MRTLLKRRLLWLAVPALVLGASSAAGDGRTVEDHATETFLLSAQVVHVEPVGRGVTNPLRVTLDDGWRRARAIFKDVEVVLDLVGRTGRRQPYFGDCYRFEAAAYRLDRLLGIGLVPVTVIRKIDGRRGSLQLWVEDAVTLAEGLEDTREVPDFDLLVQRLTLMYLFDALIANLDRNPENVLLDLAGNRFALIDHSKGFRIDRRPPDLGRRPMRTLPPGVAERLRGLDLATLQRHLGGLLSREQVRAVAARVEPLLHELEARGLVPPASEATARTGRP